MYRLTQKQKMQLDHLVSKNLHNMSEIMPDPDMYEHAIRYTSTKMLEKTLMDNQPLLAKPF